MALSLVSTSSVATLKAAAGPLTISNVVVAAGDSVVLYLAYLYTVANPTTLQWGAADFDAPMVENDNGVSVASSIRPLFLPTAGTHDVTIAFDANPTAVAAVEVWRNAATADQSAASSGAGTTPTSTATAALSSDAEAQLGMVVTVGPVEDTAGTWGNSLSGTARGGTTGGVAASNLTLSIASLVLSSAAAVTASKSGITSRSWAGLTATLRAASLIGSLRNGISLGIGL